MSTIMRTINIFLTTLCIFAAFRLLLHFDLSCAAQWVSSLAAQLPGYRNNPDTNRTIHQLIESRRFIPESHFITTSDGYILQAIRIVNPFMEDRSKLKPVLLFHGFQCSGSLWVVTSNGTLMNDGHYYEYNEHNHLVNSSSTVGNTLGFVLASQGYDVWLANYRGSIYSSNHTTLSTNDAQFWSFSMDEMIDIDLPATIDYILDQTNNQQMAYIGHSQGNFLMFTLLSKSTKYTELVKPVIALAPVVYLNDMKTPTKNFEVFKNPLRKYPTPFFHFDHVRIAYSQICSNKYFESICFYIFSSLIGTFKKNIDMSRLSVYMANIPMGSSSRNAAHFFQMFEHGHPTYFDYGSPKQNLDKHGRASPPRYNMSHINSTDIALIYLKDDWFNSYQNIELLKDSLTVDLLEDYVVPDDSLNHMELIWSKHSGKHVNHKILHILRQFWSAH